MHGGATISVVRVRIELATALMFVVLLSGAVAGYAPLREAAIDGVRGAIDSVLPASWSGYYLELDETAPATGDSEDLPSRLMFASGSLPGTAARLLEDRVYSGSWSPSGDRFVVSSGTRLFLGDRHGQVHQLADLGDLVPTGPAVWTSDRELVVATTRDGTRHWLVRLDARSGLLLDQRDLPLELEPYAPSPDGHWLLAFDQSTGAGVLYEPETGRRIAPARREAFAAWLGDGRLLVSLLDDEGAHLVARTPERTDDQVLVDLDGVPLLPAVTNAGRVAFVELQDGSNGQAGPRSIWLISAGQTPVRVAKDLGPVYYPFPSRDGRFVAFSEHTEGTAGVKVRAAVIEVATKRISYACDQGCAVLELR